MSEIDSSRRETPEAPLRRTKIVATVGPACRSRAALRELIEAGVDAFRLNFSYGSHEEHAQAVELIRELSRAAERPVAVIQDLQGPKLRIGLLAGGARRLESGDAVVFAPQAEAGEGPVVPVNRPALLRELRPGDRILLGDGEVLLRVEGAAGAGVRARVVEGGPLKENQGINLPGVTLPAEPLTEKDVADLRFGLRLGVDYVALSFARRADDVRRLKELMAAEGSRLPVIAKLERREALQHLDALLAAAEGVMVARGDLGLELPLEEVPLVQKRVIHRANELRTLVITATQMLESMVERPQPTRAEVSDVANAILDGTDAVMLSAETAVGRYPARAVQMMDRIAREVEGESPAGHAEPRRLAHPHAMSRAACELARDVGAAAIVVFTRSGYSAQLVSKERPPVPVFAFTPSESVWRQLALWWGVTPLLAPFPRSPRAMMDTADEALRRRGLLRPGQTVVIARWSPLRARGWSNFIQLYRLGRS